jgi:PAS domain S-box-containing protein
LLIIEEKQGNWQHLEKESFKTALPMVITVTTTLDDARNKLRENSFQAVVADYFLSDGICTDILPDLNGIPLIVMTSEGYEEEALKALKTGASDYLIKDKRHSYRKIMPLTVSKSIEQKTQANELQKYRNELENIVEERTIELIDMYGKLQESETNFRNIFNSTNDCIIIIGFNFEFIEANEAVLKQFGISKEFLSNNMLMNYVVPEYRPLIMERMELIKQGLPSGNMELEFISPVNGSVMPFEVSSVPIVFNQKNAILSIMRDIAERKNHARKLFETIIQTEEEERKRIATDLHDEIGPLISALKIFTTSFMESTSEEKKRKLAGQMGLIVRDVIDAIKIISNDMSPHVLVNFGLLAAVQNFIELFSRNITINFTSNIGNVRFPTTVESLIYRIIKELINNTVKHARASEINIDLEYTENTLTCRYRDNGIGFNWQKQVESPAKGMGIHNIITRIRTLGGDFEVNSQPDDGFQINFQLQTIIRDVTDQKEIQGYYRR